MKRKTIKSLMIIFALVFCLSFALALTACGGNEDKPTPVITEDGYTVTLDYNDGVSRPLAKVVEENGSLQTPAKPERAGYSFVGWKTSLTGGNTVSFPYTPTADITFYAEWEVETFTVTVDLDYDNQVTTQTVNYGTLFEEPTAPTRTNFTFRYWVDAAGNQVEFPVVIKRDYTVKAEWIDSSFAINVKFDLNYENAPKINDALIVSGETITQSNVGIVRRDGATLLGWATSADATGDEIFSLPYTPTGDVTLYAIWQINDITITFLYNDPSRADSAQVFTTVNTKAFELIEAPAEEPTRDGYTFAGWYGSASGGTEIDFATFTSTTDASVYAYWTAEATSTTIFQAEYTPIDPNEGFPGYSGNAVGLGIIQIVDTGDQAGCMVDTENVNYGIYVGYLYKPGATLTFNINSDRAVSGATISINLAVEIATSPITFAPSGDFGWVVMVNENELDYTPFTVTPHSTPGQWKSDFTLITLDATFDLVEGENVIQLITANGNTMLGGTTQAVGPQIDYIQINATGAILTWSPIYDNISAL